MSMFTSTSRIPVLSLFCCFTLAGSSEAVAPRPTGPATDETVPEGLSTGDWAGIRAAHEAGRHAAFAVEGGFEARNPGLRWTTTFDGRGVRVRPDRGDWTWGLELESYGFAGGEQPVTGPATVNAAGQRVSYAWDNTIEEWFVNDRCGLEHGYTVHRRPAHGAEVGESLLTLELNVRGGLRPVVDANGHGVRFLNGAGAVMVTYTGLHVFDAEGRTLRARFEPSGDQLRLGIDERGARYPLTIDPVAQQAYLKASNAEGGASSFPHGDGFGHSVAVSDHTVVVGAPWEASNATGVNGDQNDNSALLAGAAYVFVRNAGSWSQQAYLKASNTDGSIPSNPWGDMFGHCVAVCGDTLVVGAVGESSNATGVGGDQQDNSAREAGAAYVFVRNGSTWSQEAYLKASNTDTGDYFGHAVSVSGDTLVVGAYGECSNATGVNGNQSDNSIPTSGAAYVFTRSGTTWSQEAYLKASNTGWDDHFGWSVSVSGRTVVSGAMNEQSKATGVNGDQSDNSLQHAGAAYIFTRSASSWSQEAYLKASNTASQDYFGFSVSASGNTVLVGASLEDGGATGVNGDEGDGAPNAGAAYVFTRGGTTWGQEAYLKASNTDPGDYFGYSVAVSGDTAVVGAYREASNATGVDGDQGDNSAYLAGSAYVFARDGTDWSQQSYLKASNTDAGDWFGYSVSVSGRTVVVGAYEEASNATGVNGNQHDNSADQAGAAYTFLVPVPFKRYCFGDPGSGIPCPCANDNDGSVPESGCANGVFTSGAQLRGQGFASVSADTLVLVTTRLEPNNTGLYFQADNRLNGGNGIIFGDGLRCAGGNLIRLQVRTSDAAGTSSTTIGISAKGGVSPGDVKRYQCWYRNIVNPLCGPGVNDFNLSNGLEVTWDI